MQLKAVEITSDGSCQFSSVAVQVDKTPSIVRAEVVQWMKDHPHTHDNEPFWKFEPEFWETFDSWEDYCDEMANSTAWGNQITLIAFAENSRCKVTVYASRSEADFTYSPTTWKDGDDIVVLAYLSELHYFAALPDGTTVVFMQSNNFVLLNGIDVDTEALSDKIKELQLQDLNGKLRVASRVKLNDSFSLEIYQGKTYFARSHV